MAEEINVSQPVLRARKLTVLAYGEGEDEKIFLRHLVQFYCRRDKVTVQTGSAGGGTPTSILNAALRARRNEKRNYEFILLDTDKFWPSEMIDLAEREKMVLIGNDPCIEAFFLELLGSQELPQTSSTTKCKEFFEKNFSHGNFNEDQCTRLFPKALLNTMRVSNYSLDFMIKIIEGNFQNFNPSQSKLFNS